MIGYVNGILECVEAESCVVDVNGLGINVIISERTASALPGVGEEVKLYTYTSVREDAFLLYGFLSKGELKLFKLLITVNGIGPKAGLSLLGAFDSEDLKFAIMSQDVKTISKAPGIGAKTAGRICLELKDRMQTSDLSALTAKEGDNPYREAKGNMLEAVDALVALGYGRAESLKAVNSVEGCEDMDTGKLLRSALKMF